MDGREAAAGTLTGDLAEMTTAHRVGNVRLVIDGRAAAPTCCVLAQHLRPAAAATQAATMAGRDQRSGRGVTSAGRVRC